MPNWDKYSVKMWKGGFKTAKANDTWAPSQGSVPGLIAPSQISHPRSAVSASLSTSGLFKIYFYHSPKLTLLTFISERKKSPGFALQQQLWLWRQHSRRAALCSLQAVPCLCHLTMSAADTSLQWETHSWCGKVAGQEHSLHCWKKSQHFPNCSVCSVPWTMMPTLHCWTRVDMAKLRASLSYSHECSCHT